MDAQLDVERLSVVRLLEALQRLRPEAKDKEIAEWLGVTPQDLSRAKQRGLRANKLGHWLESWKQTTGEAVTVVVMPGFGVWAGCVEELRRVLSPLIESRCSPRPTANPSA